MLRDLLGALHVRLTAPASSAFARRCAWAPLTASRPGATCVPTDLAREAYVKHWYRADPVSPEHYHLVLDSSAISLDGCVDLIVLALARPPAVAAGAGDQAAPTG